MVLVTEKGDAIPQQFIAYSKQAEEGDVTFKKLHRDPNITSKYAYCTRIPEHVQGEFSICLVDSTNGDVLWEEAKPEAKPEGMGDQ